MKIKIEDFLADGKKLLASGNLAEAANIFINGLDKFPNELELLVGMANAEFRLGNKINAFRILIYANHLAPADNSIREFLKQVGSRTDSDSIPGITLAMIVKNEENDLPACLESTKGVVDEIVIVDTGSTDRTIEIAKDYSAKVHQTEWHDDYAKARNVSLRYSTGSWILYLDADERIDDFTQRILRKTIELCDETAGGINCTIFSKHFNDKGITEFFTGVYPRLFRNLGYPVCKFFGRVHEQISPSLTEKGYTLINSELRIIHTGYEISVDEMDKKVRRNIKILTEHAQEEPDNGLAWYQLGNSLSQMKIYDQAIPALKTAVNCGTMSPYLTSNTALRLSMILSELGKMDEAIKWLDTALVIMPDSQAALELKAKMNNYIKSK